MKILNIPTTPYQVGIATTKNRRDTNQDAGVVFYFERNRYIIEDTKNNRRSIPLSKEPSLLAGAIICDGLHNKGDMVSDALVNLFIELLPYADIDNPQPIDRFNLRSYSRIKRIEHGASTTLIHTIDRNHNLTQGYIGDSRGYIVKKNTGLVQLVSRDHNYQRTIVEHELKRDITKPHIIDFYDDPKETEYIHAPLQTGLVPATSRLTKSMSGFQEQTLDRTIYEHSSETTLLLEEEDSSITLTDGAYEAFRNNRGLLKKIITENNPTTAAKKIIQLAERTGDDNATAIVMKRPRTKRSKSPLPQLL